jgi:galactokinase
VDTLTARPEVFGARLTGGGFGGAVMALTSPRFDMDAAAAVTAAYAEKFGAAPEVLHLRTGDGATVL